LELVPTLLDQFLAAYKSNPKLQQQYRSTTTASTNGSTDAPSDSFSPPFAFFNEFFSLAVRYTGTDLVNGTSDTKTEAVPAKKKQKQSKNYKTSPDESEQNTATTIESTTKPITPWHPLSLRIIANLLGTYLHHDIYRPTNDAASKRQLRFFEIVCENILTFARASTSGGGGSKDMENDVVFEAWRMLLQLDYTVVHSRVEEILPFLLMTKSTTSDSNSKHQPHSLSFIAALLKTYTQSRQLDVFFRVLCRSILEAEKNGEAEHGEGKLAGSDPEMSVVFSAGALAEISRCVSSTLPHQVTSILQVLLTNLTQSYLPTATTSPRSPSTLTRLFTTIITAIAPHLLTWTSIQQSSFTDLITKCYAEFLQPALAWVRNRLLAADNESGSGKRKHKAGEGKEIVKSVLRPVLDLHLALCRVSDAYWARSVTSESVERGIQVARVCGDAGVWAVETQLALHHVDRLLNTTTITTTTAASQEETDLVCRTIIEKVFERLNELLVPYYSGSNGNGAAESISEKTDDRDAKEYVEMELGVAIWMAVATYMPAICRVANPTHLQTIVTILLKTLDEAASTGDGRRQEFRKRMANVTVMLLGSARFYEMKPIRDLLFPTLRTILQERIKPFLPSVPTSPTPKSKLKKKQKRKSGNADDMDIDESPAPSSHLHVASQVVLDLLQANAVIDANDSIMSKLVAPFSSHPKKTCLDLEYKPSSQSKSNSNEKDGHTTDAIQALHRLTSLLSFLNLFPLVYFTPQERDVAGRLMYALEVLVTRYVCDDGTSVARCDLVEEVVRFVAVSRRIGVRFLVNREDKLFTLNSVDYLLWCINASQLYDTLIPSESLHVTGAHRKAIMDNTFRVVDVTFRKLLQKVRNPPSSHQPTSTDAKNSATAASSQGLSYLSKWVSILQDRLQKEPQHSSSASESSSSAGLWWSCVAHFLQIVVEWVEAHKKKSSHDDKQNAANKMDIDDERPSNPASVLDQALPITDNFCNAIESSVTDRLHQLLNLVGVKVQEGSDDVDGGARSTLLDLTLEQVNKYAAVFRVFESLIKYKKSKVEANLQESFTLLSSLLQIIPVFHTAISTTNPDSNDSEKHEQLGLLCCEFFVTYCQHAFGTSVQNAGKDTDKDESRGEGDEEDDKMEEEEDEKEGIKSREEGQEKGTMLMDGISVSWTLQVMRALLETTWSYDASSEIKAKITKACTWLIRNTTESQYTHLVHQILSLLRHNTTFLVSALAPSKQQHPTRSIHIRRHQHSIDASLHILSTLLSEPNRHLGRRLLKRKVPVVLMQLGRLVQDSGSIDTMVSVFQLVTKMVVDKFLDIRAEDVGLILHMCTILASPSCLSRYISRKLSSSARSTRPQRKQGRHENEGDDEMTLLPSMEEASNLFDSVCRLLLAVLRHRREPVLACIPLLMGPTLHSNHDDDTAAGAVAPSIVNHYQQQPFALISCRSPLPASCAESFSRVLQGIGQKGLVVVGGGSGAGGAPGLEGEGTSSNVGTSTPGGGDAAVTAATARTSAMIKPFAKHVIYPIAEYISIQLSQRPIASTDDFASAKVSEPQGPARKAALVEGIYALLDVCGDIEREFLLQALGQGGFALFTSNSSGAMDLIGMQGVAVAGAGGGHAGKDAARAYLKQLVSDWIKYHRYTGKI
ncbi:hypothetical protein HK102_002628, partial [Quaeritorhiza haematococci]